MLGVLSSSLYKDNIFSREIQIAFSCEYYSEMLKCSDLQQTGVGVYYITRRAPKVGVRPQTVKGAGVFPKNRNSWLLPSCCLLGA